MFINLMLQTVRYKILGDTKFELILFLCNSDYTIRCIYHQYNINLYLIFLVDIKYRFDIFSRYVIVVLSVKTDIFYKRILLFESYISNNTHTKYTNINLSINVLKFVKFIQYYLQTSIVYNLKNIIISIFSY